MKEDSMFKGSIPALVTPFSNGDDRAVDWGALEAHVEWQIAEGSNGLVPVGTTGESPTLSHDEHKRVVKETVRIAKGRVPVIAGAGSNSTAEAIDLAKAGAAAGADGLLVVTPYYNKPSQEGLYQHFKAVAAATDLPILIYNIPGRSVIDMSVDTMARLFEIKTIVGVKDATAKPDRASAQRAKMGPAFNQLSGEDVTALAFMAHGGHGCISVTANVAPKLCAEFQAACMAGDYAKALTYQDKLYPLHMALFLEPNPQGVKYALSRIGRMTNSLRLPLTTVSKATEAAIDAALVHAGLIN